MGVALSRISKHVNIHQTLLDVRRIKLNFLFYMLANETNSFVACAANASFTYS